MSVSIAEFWKLTVESGLLTVETKRELGGEFGQVKGASQLANSRVLAEWLISRNVLSRFQANRLLAGQPGPFRFGEYTVIDEIRTGTPDVCFRATHVPSRHVVALYRLGSDVVRDAKTRLELAKRVQVLRGLSHRNVCRWYQLVDTGACQFVVTEESRGVLLWDQITADGPLDPAQACRVIWQAALGLEAIHGAGLVHGALSPRTMCVDPEANVKLICHPASRLSGSRPMGARDTDSHGMSSYLAPELALSGRAPDVLTDLYALGCSSFFLLTGQTPSSSLEQLNSESTHSVATSPIIEQLLGLPPDLAQIVTRLMATDRSARFQSASLVVERLAARLAPEELELAVESPSPTLQRFLDWIAGPAGFSIGKPSREVPSGTMQGVGAVKSARATPPDEGMPRDHRDTASVIGSRQSVVRRSTEDSDVSQRVAQYKAQTNARMTFRVAMAAVMVVVAVVVLAILKTRSNTSTGPVTEKSGSAGNRAADTNGDRGGPAIESTIDTASTDHFNTASVSAGTTRHDLTAQSYDVVDDDGQLLWASPTSGDPLVLGYVPLGAQVILVARPADILARPEGDRVVQALGPTFDSIRKSWERLAHITLDQIERIIVVMAPQNDEPPRTTIVVQLRQSKELATSWDNSSPVAMGSRKYYRLGQWAVYVPERESNRVFVMGAVEDIQAVIEADGAAPPLRRELEQLRQWSDADRDLTILFAPSFLNDGRKAFSGSLEPALEPLKWFIGDGIQACSVSLQLDHDFYGEVRMSGTVDTRPGELASQLRERLIAIPDRLDRFLGTIQLDPYWQPLALKFGQMIRFMRGQTRVGIESDQVVFNFVLPAAAAHNLVLAAELSIASGREPNVATAAPATDLTLDDVLRRKMTLAFPQQSLELAMQDLANEVNESMPNLTFAFEIQIVGADLQLEGITRNQQIKNFRMDNATVAELLTALVRRANPVTTVKEPSDQDQTLVWTIEPHQTARDRRTVLITTRRAATEKGYDLPGPFRTSASPDVEHPGTD